jgi:hypothetical protein
MHSGGVILSDSTAEWTEYYPSENIKVVVKQLHPMAYITEYDRNPKTGEFKLRSKLACHISKLDEILPSYLKG